MHQTGSDFGGMKGYAHSIATQRRDHAGGIAQHQQVIFHLRFF